jgi:hypothetical protein
MWLWLHNTLCLHYLATALLACVICFKIIGMCSVLLCLHVDQPASGSEEGGSQLMQNTENFFMLCFVCSQLGAVHDLAQMWCLRVASDAIQKVSFKNRLSFPRFFIFLNFTFIINGPFRKLKSGFHCVSLQASGLEEGWTKNLYGSGFIHSWQQNRQ